MKDADVTQQAGPASPALPIFPRFPSSCSEHGRKLLGQRVQGRARLALHGWIPRVEETESLVKPSADRQWTSRWPLGPQALL